MMRSLKARHLDCIASPISDIGSLGFKKGQEWENGRISLFSNTDATDNGLTVDAYPLTAVRVAAYNSKRIS